jgi:hypothetical protein
MSTHCSPPFPITSGLSVTVAEDIGFNLYELFDESLVTPAFLSGEAPGIFYVSDDISTYLVKWIWDGVTAYPDFPRVHVPLGGQAGRPNVPDIAIDFQNKTPFGFYGAMLQAIATFAEVDAAKVTTEFQMNTTGAEAAASGYFDVTATQRTDVTAQIGNLYCEPGGWFRERLGWNGSVANVPVGYSEFQLDSLWGIAIPV